MIAVHSIDTGPEIINSDMCAMSIKNESQCSHLISLGGRISPVANLDCGSASPFIFTSPLAPWPLITPLGVAVATALIVVESDVRRRKPLEREVESRSE